VTTANRQNGLVCLGLAACVLWWIAVPHRARAQALQPLSVEDALRTVEFGQLTPVGLSPDGRWVAYTVKNNQRSRAVDRATWARFGVRDVFTGTDIWVLNVQTGSSRNVTGGEDDNFMPVWSPDSRQLAFLSDRDGSGQLQLWDWDVDRNRMTRISGLNVRQFGQLEWTRDSRKIVVPVVPDSMDVEDYVKRVSSSAIEIAKARSEVPGSTVVLYQSGRTGAERDIPRSDPWNLDMHLRDLVLIDVASGRAIPVVCGQRIASFFVSPDGSRIAYTIPRRFEKPGSQQILFDLVTKPFSTDEEQVIATDVRFDYDGGSFSWSPDSLHLAYVTGGPEERVRDCYVADIEGRVVRNVSMLAPVPPRASKAPLWDPGGKELYFVRAGGLWKSSLDHSKAVEVARVPGRQILQMVPQENNLLWMSDRGRSTIVLTHDDAGKQDGFYRIDLATGQSTKLLEKGQCYTCANSEPRVSVQRDGLAAVFFAEDAGHDNDLWITDPSFRNPQRLTHLNSQFDRYKMGTPRLVRWFSDDGQMLSGALLLPANYQEGKRYPLIVWVYGGGSESNHFDHFGLEGSGPFNMQLFATRDYAVLTPDSPQQLGTPMIDLAKTVLPAVSKIIEMGIADPDRLGVMGHSNGGYSTLGLIVQTTRFKAALEADGMADLLGEYGEMDSSGTAFGTSNLERGQDALGGTPWEVRERYIENSPVFYLDRVETPLMIVHGSKDTAVAQFLGDEIFVDLRRLGKEVEYAKYQGEEHSPNYWSFANQVDFCDRMVAWFDRFLKDVEH